MYKICFILKDRRQGVVTIDNEIALFPEEDAAWKYIHTIMTQPEHPSFMWTVKVGEPCAK